MPTAAPHAPSATRRALALGALGVVFGDIGTSPLYTLRECLAALAEPRAGLPPISAEAGVLGLLSLIFWALVLVVCAKYLLFVTRADNQGEGGVFALLALTYGERMQRLRGLPWAVLAALAGASLLYGEGVITPAISVLSAAEGFKTLHPAFAPGPTGTNTLVLAMAVCILALLFLFQYQGTHRIGSFFGPVMLLWFAALGALGLWHIAEAPGVLRAIDPRYGLTLLSLHPGLSIAILGGVVLAITGVEALFADMGHFGRPAIALAWYAVAMPGLVFNYFGQGAFVLGHPEATINPFFALAPEGGLRVALVFLSIAATIIASQALISGTFSLTRQAIQLGFFPRLTVRHTNAALQGQIYMPLVNGCLAAGAIAAVLTFRTSSNLAGAYGIAVTGAMTMTTLAFYLVAVRRWRWPRWRARVLCGAFAVIDLALLWSNLHKVSAGGWFPLILGLGMLMVMRTWRRGREEIQHRVYDTAAADLEPSQVVTGGHIVRVPGSAVFMAATPKGTPLALLHHLKANKCLQKAVVILSVMTEDAPTIREESRLGLEDCGQGVWRAIARYGYMESPDVADLVRRIQSCGVPVDPYQATYYFNREMIFTGGPTRLWEWEKRLYAFLSRNARPARDYYKIPPAQIIEVGLPVHL